MAHQYRTRNDELSPYFIGRSDGSEGLVDDTIFASDFSEGGRALRDYWITLRKHQSLIIAVFIFALITTGAVVFTMTPQYTAKSTILIERQAPRVLDIRALTNEVQDSADEDEYYKTQYEILRSRRLAAEVISATGLERNTSFAAAMTHRGVLAWVSAGLDELMRGQADGTHHDDELQGEMDVPSPVIDAYLKRLLIQPMLGTRLVVVGFTTPDRALSARVANTHVDAYIRRGMELHAQAGEEEAQRFLESKLAELQNRVEKSEAALNSYRRSRGIVAFSLNDKGKIISQRLDDLNKALTEAETARIALESEVLQIGKQNYDSMPEVMENPVIQGLKSQLAQQQAEFASLANQFRPDYPPLAQLSARVDDTQQRLRIEDARVVAGIKTRYAAAIAREGELRAAEEQERRRAMAMNESSLQDAILAREVDTSRQLYKSVLERTREIGVDSEIRASNVSVVDRAEQPRWHSAPKRLLSLSLAGVLGLFGGVAIAFFLEFMDQSLKTPEEAERYLRLPSLGLVPDFGKSGKPLGAYLSREVSQRHANGSVSTRHRELITSDNPFSASSEAYRAIRTNVMLSRAGVPPKSILVTSADPGEGKTVTAVNIALAFSRLGGQVLLIDADLRRPRCHEVLRWARGPGLTEVLTGRRDVGSLNRHSGAESLHFLSAGSVPPNPAELLGSQMMRDLLQQVGEQYDHIVIDSPPVLPVTDTIVLSPFVDGAVVVIGPNTPRQSVNIGCTMLSRAGVKILGIILNRVDTYNNPVYHHYGYYSDHGYFGQDREEDSTSDEALRA